MVQVNSDETWVQIPNGNALVAFGQLSRRDYDACENYSDYAITSGMERLGAIEKSEGG